MSAPIRFLGLAIVAYVGLRTASSALALEPAAAEAPELSQGSDAAFAAAEPTLPPGVPADMGPEPSGPYAQAAAAPYGAPPGYPAAYPAAYGPAPYPYMPAGAGYPYPYPMMMAAAAPAQRPMRPVYYPVPYPVPARAAAAPLPAPATSFAPLAAADGYASPVAPLDQWPTIGAAGPISLASTETQVTPGWGKRGRKSRELNPSKGAERWSVDAWALLRPREGVYRLDDTSGALNPGLAPAGSLGGSQAGMRISWTPLSSLGVHLRASTALMQRGTSAKNQQAVGGEGAFGISWKPVKGVPLRLLAERRQRLGAAIGGGRDAFALLAEGGLYGQQLPYGITLDGYGQAGVVGANRRDLFADGALTATYPFMPRFAIGGGMWGGIQPGLSRFDAGPRLSYQLRPGLRAHLDYRFRVTGNAEPRSGPALTLAAGF